MIEEIKIDTNTYRFEDGFVRFFLLEGSDKAVLIDSGMNCSNAAELASKYTSKPVILLNTHGDGDHTSGTNGFSEIYMHELDYINCEVNTRYPNTKLKAINDGDVIDLGDRPLRIIHIPGHTKGSIAILDTKSRVLYSGDSVQKGHIYMFGDKRDPEKYAASLDKLIALEAEYDYIYASHDEFCIPNDYAKKVKSVWQGVLGGEMSFENIDLWGNQVKSYTTDICGFYLQ